MCKNFKLRSGSPRPGSREKLLYFIGLSVLIIVLLFIAVFFYLPANYYKDPAQERELEANIKNYVAEAVNSADNVLLAASAEPGSDEITLTMRKITDLASFVKKSKRPVLLAIRELGNGRAEPVIEPLLEDLAEKYYRKLYVVLVDPDQKDDFLENLDFRYVPTFYLWQSGIIKAEISGYTDQALQELQQKVQEITLSNQNH